MNRLTELSKILDKGGLMKSPDDLMTDIMETLGDTSMHLIVWEHFIHSFIRQRHQRFYMMSTLWWRSLTSHVGDSKDSIITGTW